MEFTVTCGASAGTLHKKRFASGNHGRCIRTETSWMTPVAFLQEASAQADVSWKKAIEWEGKPISELIQAQILKIHSLLCDCRLCKPQPGDLEDEKNDDECCVCKSDRKDEEEELVECDDCPRSFHPSCHLPHVEDAILRNDSAWMCTFCVFGNIQQWRYSDEQERDAAAAMSRQMSRHLLTTCQYLLLSLYSADHEQIFATDPRMHLKDYSTVVETPMWLGRVADRLQEDQYQTVGQFVSDIQLIFTNCTTYNRNNAEFLATGERLKRLFDGEFKKAFNIREETLNR